ncbi:MAG TPA: hypothetical protein ENI99_13960 [Sedimenticola sp.]|nr:hypothetical protein [Sedimenticola sp.]
MKIATIATILLASYLLYGCNASSPARPASPNSLVGVDKETLTAALGQPKYVLNASAPGAPLTRSYVYDIEENGRACAASYLVDVKTGKVISYSCF